MNHHFDLDIRQGLPADLRELVARYPRDEWMEHDNLGATARFWLKRHDMFRELGASLSAGLADYREDRVDIAAFRRWFARRLGFFLENLEGHHQIEDQHYFPVFQAADRRLAHGFDLLENDHEVIHGDLMATAETANRFLTAEATSTPTPDDPLKRAAEAYAEASERLLRRLMRHLEDEEDLIIPLILDRGEADIGI